MNKKIILLAILLVSLLAAGCMDVQVNPKSNLAGLTVGPEDEETIGVVNINNWGFFFFDWPIVTGDCQGSQIIWFDDDTEIGDLMKVLSSRSSQMGGSKVYNTYSQISNYGFMFFVRTTNLSGTIFR